jgi:hypothetical protein
MLPCELPNDLPPLDPAEFDRRLNGFIADVLAVARHVISEPEYHRPRTKSIDALAESLMRPEFPDLNVLNRIVGYVLWRMQWDAEHRREPLTPAERDIWAAAWRLSDAMWGPRDTP